MAASPLNQKTQCHARSISLPSRSHSLSQFDEQLSRFQASEEASSSSAIGHKLSSLKDLHNCVDNLLGLSTTRRTLTQECHNKWVNELLDGLLRLLDVCSTAKDVLLMTKDSAQQLQSVLRRKRGDQFEVSCAIEEYLTHRKKVKKAIHKALRHLIKWVENKGSPLIKENHETAVMVSMLKEVESISYAVFGSFLSFILGTKLKPKPSGWCLVSKLMRAKHVACDEASEISEVEKVDAELYTLTGHKMGKSTTLHVEITLKRLQGLELSLEDLEVGLECLYRNLIKIRVSLLNILNC